jgi:enoyl-CoA hydratase/carnithine racemase
MTTRRATTSPLLSSTRDGVVWLTLNRPAASNRITPKLAQALVTATDEIQLDDNVRLVVIDALGTRFCSGVEAGGNWERRCDWVAAVARLSVPVIGAVQGDAIAEGFELALACDLRLLSERARLGMTQLTEGRLPSHGGTQRLPRAIGRMRALDLLASGRTVEAKEAERIGLATRVFPARTFARDVRRTVTEVSRKGPIALRYAKEAVLQGFDMTLDQGIRLEEDLYVLLQTTSDRGEGVRAFLAKRRPKFKGQ